MKTYGKTRVIAETEEGGEDDDEEEMDLPTNSGRGLKYPEELAFPTQKKERTTQDPFQHLGPIGYTRNTWRSKGGSFQKAQNTYLGFHVKESAKKELARRLVLAESLGGLPRDIDKDSLVSDEKYFFKKGKAPDRTKNMEKHEKNKPMFSLP